MTEQINSNFVDFRLDSFPSDADIESKVLAPIRAALPKDLVEIKRTNSSKTKRKTICLESQSGEDIFVLVRVYDRKSPEEKVLLTISIELPNDVEEKIIEASPKLDMEDILIAALKENFGAKAKMNTYPPIRRCLYYFPYLLTSDDRIMEPGYKEVLYDVDSEFQNIKIADTVDFGRVLVLDGEINLAESDTVAYTHSLMNLPAENYKDKEVLILGGGDGSLLKELFDLKFPNGIPKFVTMVDIDEGVMIGCDKYMSSVCGDFLKKDNRKGDRHEIIVGDAIEFMKNALASGKRYDYVFGDMTDDPVTEEDSPEVYAFFKSVIELGVQLIKPRTGKYMTHYNAKAVPKSLALYEKMLGELAGGKCIFERGESFVPSFLETWMLYRVIRTE